jgi:hypothetical protein
MRGYISIELPVKPYVRAYIIHRYGLNPVLSKDNDIGNKLYDLLEHATNERASEYSSKVYTTSIKVFISMRTFRVRGSRINETNVQNLNQYIEDQIKFLFHYLMDFYISILPSFVSNLTQVRFFLGISEDDWETDSMKKDYYRYRKKQQKPLLYDKTISRNVLPVSLDDKGF